MLEAIRRRPLFPNAWFTVILFEMFRKRGAEIHKRLAGAVREGAVDTAHGGASAGHTVRPAR